MLENRKKEFTFWPYGIIFSIFLIICACIVTIRIASKNPVEMDSYYLEKYQNVDRDMNTIKKNQEAFFKKYEIKYYTETLFLSKENTISFSIIDKDTQKNLENADITLLLTRPETNKNNQNLHKKKAVDGKFIFDKIVLDKPGRWQIKAKIKINDFIGFHEHEILAIK